MLVLILLCLLMGGLFIQLIQKAFFRKSKSNIEQLWKELEKEDWFRKLIEDPKVKDWIDSDKERGLLNDPYYVRKIIDKEVHRDCFITYVLEKAN
ncbi:hypothetical protein [Halalkalibacter alkaliphilus]|uniref:Uncharacterized protein n=1 Tax=Halalkalibacter alkaliphilus TaxID=2917993 RepID=A0A9X2I514_9BACI|nr:hypothetical protein [Halalkalibacter alkaliphilus]MCL7748132.1 hypothetical protein [Halalkalibacter alkaliphilus]